MKSYIKNRKNASMYQFVELLTSALNKSSIYQFLLSLF